MKYPKLILPVLLLSIFTASLPTTYVQAADYEEVTYDSLLNELTLKKNRSITKQNNNYRFNDIQIHAGFGLLGSVSSIKTNEGQFSRYQDGLQLSMGIDLFSANWAAEGVFRNFGSEKRDNENLSLREFDLKVIYRNKTSDRIGYRIGGGLTTRYLKYNSPTQNVNDSTPFSLVSFGMDSFITKNMSIGLETSLRTSMITRTIDKNAVDVALRLDTYF